jgi:hypothetical protein
MKQHINTNKNKNDNIIIVMDTKGIDKLLIYKFINVIHSLHKLFEALVASRLTLTLLAYVARILI